MPARPPKPPRQHPVAPPASSVPETVPVDADATRTSRSTSGLATWRRIAEQLRRRIAEEDLAPGDRLPSEHQLAEQFGVNRHTVRAALGALADDGLIEAQRGSGTYVSDHRRLVHKIGVRTRLTDSLAAQGSTAGARLMDARLVAPRAPIARALGLGDTAPALMLDTVRFADGVPITRGTHWFDPALVPNLARHFEQRLSMTAALSDCGINDYVRASSTVSARYATEAESAALALPADSVVLVVTAIDRLTNGTPLQYAVTAFPAERIELALDPDISDERSGLDRTPDNR